MATRVPAILVCGSIAWRLEQLERALEAIRAALPGKLAGTTLGYRTREDLAVLLLEPAAGADTAIGPAASKVAQLPGLRAVDGTALGTDPAQVRERALRGCDLVIEIQSPREAIAKFREAVRPDSEFTGRIRANAVSIDLRDPALFVAIFTRDLASGTLFVPSEDAKPPVGSGIALEILLPDDEEPIRAMATVIHHGDVAGRGFGTRVALTDAARSRLRETAQRLQANEPARANRVAPRVPVRLAVSFESGRALTREFTENLSRGGVYVRTQKPPAAGTITDLALRLPGGEELSIRAEVVHVVTPEQARARGVAPGCGLKFQDLDRAIVEKLEAYVTAVQERPKARVLLVGNADLFRRVLAEELAVRGCEVLEASTGEEAREKLIDELLALDLLVLDVDLAGISGLELLRWIRRVGGETDLAVALVTRQVDEARVKDALVKAGADEVLSKALPAPAQADKLVQAIARKSAL